MKTICGYVLWLCVASCRHCFSNSPTKFVNSSFQFLIQLECFVLELTMTQWRRHMSWDTYTLVTNCAGDVSFSSIVDFLATRPSGVHFSDLLFDDNDNSVQENAFEIAVCKTLALHRPGMSVSVQHWLGITLHRESNRPRLGNPY